MKKILILMVFILFLGCSMSDGIVFENPVLEESYRNDNGTLIEEHFIILNMINTNNYDKNCKIIVNMPNETFSYDVGILRAKTNNTVNISVDIPEGNITFTIEKECR